MQGIIKYKICRFLNRILISNLPMNKKFTLTFLKNSKHEEPVDYSFSEFGDVFASLDAIDAEPSALAMAKILGFSSSYEAIRVKGMGFVDTSKN